MKPRTVNPRGEWNPIFSRGNAHTNYELFFRKDNQFLVAALHFEPINGYVLYEFDRITTFDNRLAAVVWLEKRFPSV